MKFGTICGILFISILFVGCKQQKSIKIIASTSSCFGDCPVLDLKLTDNTIYFNLIKYNKNKGFNKYVLKQKEIKYIDSLVKLVEFGKLKSEYIAEIQDVQRVNTMYKIGENPYKSVYYYYEQVPDNYKILIDYLMNLRFRELSKLDTIIDFPTRERVKVIRLPIPPLPEKYR